MGNVTYGISEQFRYGPVSWTFETNPAPPEADVQRFQGCITEIFGPSGMNSPYVTKLTKNAGPPKPTDPRWFAMLHCFKAHGLATQQLGTNLVAIGKIGPGGVGVVEDDHRGNVPGTVFVGPMSYIINSTPPPSAADKQAFLGCVHSTFRG